ncbi:MAG: 4Fe-4S binding protein [Phycisphaerae bacterium]|nr:4Fe-4S binding protein [Phycisphaerae bacterium]
MRRTRHVIQGLFLALIVAGVFVFRRNLEVWCPFGGVECLSLYLRDGKMLCALGASNFFILAAILLLTLGLKRVFCGYMCPLGTLAEWMRCLARRWGIRPLEPSAKVNRILSWVPILLLVAVLWWTFAATELIVRPADPCFALIGTGTNEEVPWTACGVLGLLIVGSLLVSMPFCRWICPLGAVLNGVSRLGLTRIHRNTSTCVDCGRCSKACPMGIEVAQRVRVTEARCLACGECVQACPVKPAPALDYRFLNHGPMRHPHGWIAVSVALCVALAVTAAYAIPLPTFMHARDLDRPATVAECSLHIEGVTCSGSARQLILFLDRDDAFAVPGYLKVLTSPGPGFVKVRLQYDPARTDPSALVSALVEPYYDRVEARWRPSPFQVEGYDPLAGF